MPEERFTAMPDEATLTATVLALEEHGFGVEVVDDFEAEEDRAGRGREAQP